MAEYIRWKLSLRSAPSFSFLYLPIYNTPRILLSQLLYEQRVGKKKWVLLWEEEAITKNHICEVNCQPVRRHASDLSTVTLRFTLKAMTTTLFLQLLLAWICQICPVGTYAWQVGPDSHHLPRDNFQHTSPPRINSQSVYFHFAWGNLMWHSSKVGGSYFCAEGCVGKIIGLTREHSEERCLPPKQMTSANSPGPM